MYNKPGQCKDMENGGEKKRINEYSFGNTETLDNRYDELSEISSKIADPNVNKV